MYFFLIPIASYFYKYMQLFYESVISKFGSVRQEDFGAELSGKFKLIAVDICE